METSDNIYDAVIIGSGMGGLACANILAQEGKKIIVLEKNRQIGGNLQVFSRDKCVFDTGVHYLGGLDKGQSLYQLFKYFGILDDLKLRRMDDDGFDHIYFKNDNTCYRYGIGYENFIKILCDQFPEEKTAIEKYCAEVKSTAENLPLAQLNLYDDNYVPEIDFTLNAKDFINSLTANKQLQKVLAGNNALYAGSWNSPFYVHALVLHYYIESSWKCVDGASQIALLMKKRINQLGGEVLNRAEVVSAQFNEDGSVGSVMLSNGKTIKGSAFISNLHPTLTMDIFGKEHFNQRFVDRLSKLNDTQGMFLLHIVFQDNTFEYINHNIYQINNEDPWNMEYTDESWPPYYFISVPPNSQTPSYAKGISVITTMRMDEMEKWKNTYNNVTQPDSRGEEYENFKIYKSEKLIDAMEDRFPGIRKKIKSYSSSTPLTHRDYTSSPNGSAYGLEKDSGYPFSSMIQAKTNIPNLYLTGQNIILHGILGVCLTALTTCFHLVDKEKLLLKIKNE